MKKLFKIYLVSKLNKIIQLFKKPNDLKDVNNIFCPVCGYYCIGKGGIGCINKLSIYNLSNKKSKINYKE